jgi:hypothetical protein
MVENFHGKIYLTVTSKNFMTQEDQSFPAEEKSLISSDSDLFLMTLVELVNVASLELSITLFAQGTVISGMLIGEKPYFEALNNELKSTGFAPDEAIHTFIQKFESASTNLSETLKEQNKPINREFIHLKNAKFYSGNSFGSTTRELYWRGRLSRIDGFFLGS